MKSHIILAGLLGLSWFNIASAENDKGEDQYLSRVRQLTLEGRRSGEGYFSPDGKNIIFQSEREKGNPFYQIYTMSLETGDVLRVSLLCRYVETKALRDTTKRAAQRKTS